jgi:hypothetical protein
VALGQVFARVLQFFPVNFIPSVLHYLEKRKKLIIFITGLHNKSQGCGASVASSVGPFTIIKTPLLQHQMSQCTYSVEPVLTLWLLHCSISVEIPCVLLTECVCVFCLVLTISSDISLNSINSLVFVMEMQCVYCEGGTEY